MIPRGLAFLHNWHLVRTAAAEYEANIVSVGWSTTSSNQDPAKVRLLLKADPQGAAVWGLGGHLTGQVNA